MGLIHDEIKPFDASRKNFTVRVEDAPPDGRHIDVCESLAHRSFGPPSRVKGLKVKEPESKDQQHDQNKRESNAEPARTDPFAWHVACGW
ncbi:hypothetical protein GCM10009611_09160 [Arthrobacter roseus]